MWLNRLLVLALLGLAWAAPALAQEVYVVKVNGTGISIRELDGAFNEYLAEKKLHLLQVRDPNRMKRMREEVLDTLVDQELLWQEAKRQKIVASPKEVDDAYAILVGKFKSEDRLKLKLDEEGYTVDSYKEHIKKRISGDRYADSVAAKAAKATDAEIHDFYKNNPDKFHRAEMARARHILIRVAPDAKDEQRAEARHRIEDILAKAKAGTDFAELARTYSEDATKQWGGELDPFPRGQMPKPFEEAVFALKPGEISGVVATVQGLHIIQLEALIPEVTVSEKDAHDRIKSYLDSAKGEEAVKAKVQDLRSKAKIEMLLPL